MPEAPVTPCRNQSQTGFTLIELSIVLVIIGLVVGGVLIGRDLIQAAEIRATISQIEQYKTAIATFRTKYNYLPGDLPAAQADDLGFVARGGGIGDGDGNGFVEGLGGGAGNESILGGETAFFWTDLSSASLIAGQFSYNIDAVLPPLTMDFTPYAPPVKIHNGAMVFAFTKSAFGNKLYFEIAKPWIVDNSSNVTITDALDPVDAHSIDSKIDDGDPLRGTVVTAQPGWTVGGGYLGQQSGNVGASGHCMGLKNGTVQYNLDFPGPLSCNLLIGTGL